MSDFQARLTTCFTTVFPKLREKEIPSATMATVEGWDSLATATLVTVLEEEFGVQVKPQDVEQMVSFRQILQYLTSKG
jgi:acyl carrier protein